MDYVKQYSGEFLSVDDRRVTVELWVVAENYTGNVGELRFAGDSPVVIERSYGGKEEPLEGATLSVIVESPGDRTYTGLYSIDPGSVRMDISVDGELYWRGAMDAETYSEPYECTSEYDVTLCGTDFGILSRRHWEMRSGFMSVMSIVHVALDAAGLGELPVDCSMISTELPGTGMLVLDEISVSCANFFDDDGDGLTMDEVIRGVLQPLGLHMRQWRGRIYIYDINGLCNGNEELVYWSADQQTLGVDRVYNTCRITFSPGARKGNLLPEEAGYCMPPEWLMGQISTSQNVPMVEPYTASGNGHEWMWWGIFGTNNGSKSDQYDNPGAAIIIQGDEKAGCVEVALDRGVRCMRIKSLNSGEDCAGVAVVWPSMQYTGMTGSGNPYYWHCSIRRWGVDLKELLVPREITGTHSVFKRRNMLRRLFKTVPISIGVADAQWVKITVEMLMDGRLNPWESIVNNDIYNLHEWSSKKAKERIDAYAWMVRIPFRLLFRSDKDGGVWLWKHNNMEQFKTQPFDTYGKWMRIDDTDIDSGVISDDSWSYLSYWENDRGSQSAVGGWKKNRPHIMPGKYDIYETLKRGEGQYVRNPARDTGISSSGELWLEVYDGDWIVGDDLSIFTPLNVRSHLRWRLFSKSPIWILFKLPVIELLDACFPEVEISDEDIITEGVIHPSAAEDIEISTICGTGMGLYGTTGVYVAFGRPLEGIYRADKEGSAEELLVRTLLSNYGHRHTTLSGEMRIPSRFGPLSEVCQNKNTRFILGDSAEDLHMWTTEASIVEISPDDYEEYHEEEIPGAAPPPWSDVEQSDDGQ